MSAERRRILITGASSGLGAGMAREFARRGRDLALCARRLEALQALKDELASAHPDIRISIRALNVCDHAQVFEVFGELAEELGGLDRVIVNAGIAQGGSLGTGQFSANLRTAETNFTAALAQAEAALEIFRAQNAGHLVGISSVSAMRGMKGAMSIYAASKAGMATLFEGIRADLLKTPIKVSTIYPGYILTDINRDIDNAPFRVSLQAGVKAMVKAIDREPHEAYVPGWPWELMARLMKTMPVAQLRKFS